MKYPSSKKLAEMDKKLNKIEGARALPKNASYVEKIKYDLCKKIIAFIRIKRITQIELAGRLGLDPARISEIVNYKIDKFTVDTLLTYNREIDPEFEVKFKSAI